MIDGEGEVQRGADEEDNERKIRVCFYTIIVINHIDSEADG